MKNLFNRVAAWLPPLKGRTIEFALASMAGTQTLVIFNATAVAMSPSLPAGLAIGLGGGIPLAGATAVGMYILSAKLLGQRSGPPAP